MVVAVLGAGVDVVGGQCNVTQDSGQRQTISCLSWSLHTFYLTVPTWEGKVP